MRIGGRKHIVGFGAKYSDSRANLSRWVAITETARWSNQTEVRAVFASVDFVGGLAVFNIGGNKYRLIAEISFRAQFVDVRHVLSHKEYDKGMWKQ